AGLFAVSAGTAPANVQECVDVVVDQLRALAETGPSAAELALAKEHLKGNLTLSLESTSSRMIRLGRNEFNLGRQVPTEEIEEAVDRVERSAVTALANELFAGDQLGLCVLGPVDAARLRWLDGAAVA
ncbi:MAG: M16 family metallopeptidase, partial [Vulcanimicrobiaceae bacterium]